MDNLWCIDLRELREFVPGQSEYSPNPQWELIKINGNVRPPALSNHSSVVYKNKMYLFGGSSMECENVDMYTLDLSSSLFKWSIVKTKAEGDQDDNFPKTRDEHSCVLYDNSMIVFGGFTFGQRTNDIFKYDFSKNTWSKIANAGKDVPLPRAGHSAVIKYDDINGDCMFIFGGKDDDNNKLNDTWKFNFKSAAWTQIVGNPEEQPTERSGHSAQVYKDQFMIIYGGIHFVTRELNDMHVLDMKKEKWVCLLEELNSPAKSSMQPPGSGLRKAQSKLGNDSPRKNDGTGKGGGFGGTRTGAGRMGLGAKGKRKPKPKISTGLTG